MLVLHVVFAGWYAHFVPTAAYDIAYLEQVKWGDRCPFWYCDWVYGMLQFGPGDKVSVLFEAIPASGFVV